MDIDKTKWYWSTLDALEENGFRCETCAAFDDGLCTWAGKTVSKNDFCTNWGAREAAK